MGQYKATAGQNIYDVALHIYGSLDGLADLLINNTDLSLADTIQSGTVFRYTDELIVDSSVVKNLNANSVVPANGTRGVYFKDISIPLNLILVCSNLTNMISIHVSGNGNLLVDWGDNSDIQSIKLGSEVANIPHIFNSKISANRQIKCYGTADFSTLDISDISTTEVYFLRDITIENYIHAKCKSSLEHLRLSKNTLNIDLHDCRVTDLTPIIACNQLMTLNINSNNTHIIVIENYLKSLVTHYGHRRGCTINIQPQLSGSYKEPVMDSNSKYVINSAMEAVWVLVNEPTWQEAGFWKITINNKTYTTEQ